MSRSRLQSSVRPRALVGAAAAILLVALPASQTAGRAAARRPQAPAVSAVPAPVARYFEMADRFASGPVEPVVREMASLDHTLADTTVRWLAGIVARDGVDPRLATRVRAAALLHTHTALAGAPATRFEQEWHLAIARRLVDLQARPPAREPADATARRRSFERRWWLAMAWYRHGALDLQALAAAVRTLTEKFRDDPEVLLQSGSFAETLAWSRLSATAIVPASLKTKSREAWLADAQSAYERALAADPDLDEARLRLGQVLSERGRHAAALAALSSVLQRATSQRLVYLARLFSGRACEHLGRFADAVAHYRAAAASCPACQAPLVALSHAAMKSGDAVEAGASASAVATMPSSDVIDPLWEYYSGQFRNLPALLERMRREVAP